MVRIARERIDDLFALAEKEATAQHRELSDRYVRLARKVGMRYNIRLLAEYRELYCRACSSYWVEGVTVRTRLRSGRRTRACLICGHRRRTVVHGRPGGPGAVPAPEPDPAGREDEALVGSTETPPPTADEDEPEEE